MGTTRSLVAAVWIAAQVARGLVAPPRRAASTRRAGSGAEDFDAVVIGSGG